VCGITGFISNSTSTEEIAESVRRIAHRGPDADGTVIGKLGDMTFGLGHTRLSIIDLDKRANQPMSSQDNRFWLTYNGEIYNYLELRTELETIGYQFRTDSDTEALLHAFAHWGVDSFRRLRGIFAAVILDTRTGSVFLLRDQMGVKPLYYHLTDDGELFFASELAALFAYNAVPQSVNDDDLYEFLNCGFVWEPHTGFRDILKVEPGNYALFNRGRLEKQAYFSLDENTRLANQSDLATSIRSACNEQLVADVPVALLFSGGTDSTVIANETRDKVQALFMRYNDHETIKAGQVNDKAFVQAISDKLELETSENDFTVSPQNADDFLFSIKSLADEIGEPISDYTYSASKDICGLARSRGFKVVLSGMGGDEAFAGYPRHLLVYLLANRSILTPILGVLRTLLRKIPRISKKISRLMSYLSEEDFALAYCRTLGYFSDAELKALVPHHHEKKLSFKNRLSGFLDPVGRATRLKKALRLDYHGFLAHNLTVADRSSMRVAVEMRVPLLDHRLYVQATNLSDWTLLRHFRTKAVLKRLLRPRLGKTLAERPKTGFNPPLDGHIDGLGKERLAELLTTGPITRYLNTDVISRLLDDHFAKRENNTYKLWQLLFLRFWLERWDVRK